MSASSNNGRQRTSAERVSQSFEGFNVYAQRAQKEGNENADVDALLAVAFEISQLRFHLRQVFDRKEVT